MVQLGPERAGAGPDAVEVLCGRRPERGHRLHLPVGLGAGLRRQEAVGVGREDHLDPAPPAPGMARDSSRWLYASAGMIWR